jgi:hypothetical protein
MPERPIDLEDDSGEILKEDNSGDVLWERDYAMSGKPTLTINVVKPAFSIGSVKPTMAVNSIHPNISVS